jgi:hypothetical protein
VSEQRTISVSTRVPQWWVEVIERHQERLRQTARTPRVSLADALRDLIALGIESQEPGIKLFGGQPEQLPLPGVEPTTTVEAVDQAPPGASAIEQAAAAAIQPFDTTRYYLGKLCPRHHEYGATRQSLLRLRNQSCPQCEKELRREKRAKAREAQRM